MRVTIKRIAEDAGLSHQTVSFVLGQKAHLFRPETQQRVREAASRLGYRPNGSARAMRAGRFNTLAILLSTESGRSTLFTNFLMGAEHAARAAGQHLLVTAMPDEQLTNPDFVPRILGEALADGLLVNYYVQVPAQLADLIVRCRIPSVWTNARRAADCVYPDDFAAGRTATERLITAGHRRIAYLDTTHGHPFDAGRDHYSAFDRHEGYRMAMREAGLPVQEFLPPQALREVEIGPAVKDWLAQPSRPSAVVTYCDVEIFAILHGAMSLGLKLPGDLAMASFAEQPIHCGMAPVTTMLIPMWEMGRVAVEMLMKKMARPTLKLRPQAVPFEVHEART